MAQAATKRLDIKLVALDFDLTIYDYAAPKRTVQLLQWFERLADKDVIVGLASGRSVEELKQPLAELNMPWASPFPHYVICNEGQIVDPEGESWQGASPWNTHRSQRVAETNAALYKHFEGIAAWAKQQNIPITRNIVAGDQGINIVLDTPASAQRALEWLKAQVVDADAYYLSRNHHIVLALPHNLDKGAAVAELAKLQNLKPSQVLVIGDNLNDMSMLSADRGFTVATPSNADPRIRACVESQGGIVAKRRVSLGVADIFTKVFGPLHHRATTIAR